MHATPTPERTAIVTGAGRGFGRAIALALADQDWRVVGLSRSEDALTAVQREAGPRFIPVGGDATDEALADRLMRTYAPTLVVLNAGSVPHTAPLHEQAWTTFTENWNVDTRHVFEWVKAALRLPLAPGSTVMTMSSGAALHGSPLSGGYAGAKAMIGFMASYASSEASRMGLDVRFTTLYPTMSATGVGMAGVRAYAERQGVTEDEFVAALGPILTPELVADAVVRLASDDASAPAYVLSGTGPTPLAS